MTGRQGMFDGTVKCHQACNGQTPCIAACTDSNKAWNETAGGYNTIDNKKIIPFSQVNNSKELELKLSRLESVRY